MVHVGFSSTGSTSDALISLHWLRVPKQIQWHRLDHMHTIVTSLQTDNHTNTSSLNFYRLDALPDTQPTVSNK